MFEVPAFDHVGRVALRSLLERRVSPKRATAMGDALGWTYRKDWFAKPELQAEFKKKHNRDLAPPKTQTELKEVAEFFQGREIDGKKVYGVNAAAKPPLFEYAPLLYQDGGRIMTPDAKKFVADSPEFLSALQKLQDLNTVHKVVPPTYGTDDQAALLSQFKDQKNLAMWIATPGTIRGLQNDKVPFEVLPIPTGKLGKPVTTGGIGMYAVVETKDAEKEKAAHELGRWLTGAEVAAAVPGYQLAPSFRKSNTALKGDPAYSKVQDMVQYGIYEPPTTVPNEIRNIGLLSAFQSVMLGQKSPADAMKSIQPEFQAELDKMNK